MLRKDFIMMNMSKAEYFSLKSQYYSRTGQQTITYNISDNNLGPTFYLLDLYHEQCQLHLYDDKGTKEPILESPKQANLTESCSQIEITARDTLQ